MEISLSRPGVLSCAGDLDSLFDAACTGDQKGIAKLTVAGGGTFFAGHIQDDAVLSSPNFLSAPAPAKSGQKRIYRIAGACLEQIRPLVEEALKAYGPDRIGVCAGSCDNGSEASLAAHRVFLSDGVFPADYTLREQEAGLPSQYIAEKFGLQGPALTISTACASGAGAIVKGAELIRAGFCDAVIAGGVDIASDTTLLGFSALEAVSPEICNPFSKNRKGITLGDGAAFFLMEAGKKNSGTGINLLGYGESADAHHMTAPRPDGAGAIQAMKEALSRAGLGPEAVDYLNLHGTGTGLNDSVEALAVASVFSGTGLPVSSTKPITGHTLGAAGALELALCWMVLDRGGPLPVHCWDGVRDEALPGLRFVVPGGRAERLRICMSSSFAFGGCNTVLIIGKRE
jgi:3-oxoacyl-[acyl-carrier-protein] synthase-1